MENNKAIEILSKIVRKEPINQEEHSFINEWQNENSINQQIYIFVTTKHPSTLCRIAELIIKLFITE